METKRFLKTGGVTLTKEPETVCNKQQKIRYLFKNDVCHFSLTDFIKCVMPGYSDRTHNSVKYKCQTQIYTDLAKEYKRKRYVFDHSIPITGENHFDLFLHWTQAVYFDKFFPKKVRESSILYQVKEILDVPYYSRFAHPEKFKNYFLEIKK